jgi:hypothetical protein
LSMGSKASWTKRERKRPFGSIVRKLGLLSTPWRFAARMS